MAELHDWGRKKPGGLTVGTPGLGSPSHLRGSKILLADKVPSETVHYRGGAPMMAELITGRVDVALLSGRKEAPRAGARRRRALGAAAGRADPGRAGLRQGTRGELVRAWRAGRHAAGAS